MQPHENAVGNIIAYKLPKVDIQTAYSLCLGYDIDKNSYIVSENGKQMYVHKDSFLHVQKGNLKEKSYLLIRYELASKSENNVTETAKQLQNDLLEAIHSISVSESPCGATYTLCELVKALINHKPEILTIYEK